MKFFIIGVWNTLFGVLVFSLLYYFFGQRINYMFLVVVANMLAITNAYIFYKVFVFKTRGNYLAEYLRFYVVYGVVFLFTLIFFPTFMEIVLPFLKSHMPARYAPVFAYKAYIAQILTTAVTMFVSYFGHDNISFRKRADIR